MQPNENEHVTLESLTNSEEKRDRMASTLTGVFSALVLVKEQMRDRPAAEIIAEIERLEEYYVMKTNKAFIESQRQADSLYQEMLDLLTRFMGGDNEDGL